MKDRGALRQGPVMEGSAPRKSALLGRLRRSGVGLALASGGLVCSSLACGGRVDEEVPPTGKPTAQQTPPEAEDAPAAPAPAPGDGPDLPSAAIDLDECKPGFSPSRSDKPCNWLAKGLCYLTKPAACSCICPRDGESTCYSDFYGGEDSETRVFCL